MNNQTDHSNTSEETPLLPPGFSLNQRNNNDDTKFDTLADSIRFIIKRDSEMALKGMAPKSPWQLDSIVGSPMLSSPHAYVTIPNLQKRRQNQIDRHRLQQEMRYEQKRNARRDQLQVPVESNLESISSDNLEQMVTIEHEDEQWERKRQAKLRMVKKSSSSNSFASSIGFGSTDDYSPTSDMILALKEEFEKTQNPPSVAFIYGIINTVIVLPVIMSFGSIIYHDAFFRPYLPVLIKLTVISGVVHQLSFSTFSTLPFAVSQIYHGLSFELFEIYFLILSYL